MPEAKARLVAVSSKSAGPESAGSRESRSPSWATRRGAGLLLLLAAVLAAGLLIQTLRIGEFQAAIRGLGAERASSRAELKAHEHRMALVRTSVGELQTRLAGLSELVSPEVPADEASAP